MQQLRRRAAAGGGEEDVRLELAPKRASLCHRTCITLAFALALGAALTTAASAGVRWAPGSAPARGAAALRRGSAFVVAPLARLPTSPAAARVGEHANGAASDFKAYLWSKRGGTRRAWYVIMTFTTAGYLPMTVNLLLHLERHGMLRQTVVLCVDDASHRALVEMGYDPFRYRTGAVSTEHGEAEGKTLIEFGTVQFGELMKLKLHVMRTVLEAQFQFLFVDGDVVLLRNPMQHLLTDMKPYDVVYQHNGAGNCNTGFMFWRPTRETLAVLASRYPGGVDEQAWLCRAIQRGIARTRHTSLSKELFVAGKIWYSDARRKTLLAGAAPFMVHYNWRKGGTKKQALMMLHHHWLATPERDRAAALAVAEGTGDFGANSSVLAVPFITTRRHQLSNGLPTGLAPGTEEARRSRRRGDAAE